MFFQDKNNLKLIFNVSDEGNLFLSGEIESSKNLAQAATTMAASPGALHLRTLATLNDLSSDQSNTIVFAVPIEVLRAVENKMGTTKQ